MRCEIPDIEEDDGAISRNAKVPFVTYSICPITPKEGAAWRIPDGVTLQKRIDTVLGVLFELDTTNDSPLKNGWEWRQTHSDFTGLPVLEVTVERTPSHCIRAVINEDILRLLGLEPTR